MSYDAEIRIKTKIDSEPVKELGTDIEAVSKRAQNAKDRMDSLDKAGVPHTAAAYREAAADLKKWSAELEGIQSTQKGASDSMNYFRRETERYKAVLKDLESNGKYFGDEEYDQAYASLKRLESMLSVYKKNVVSSTDSTNHFKREISQITGELASLEREGYYFGDNEYDEVYRSLQNAINAPKEYKAQLDKSTESGMAEAAERAAKAKEREEAAQRRLQEQAERNLQRENARLQKQVEAENKIQAQAAEEQRLAAIKSSAVVTDEKIVAALERKKQLTAEIKELEKAGLGQGYSEWDSRQRELASVNAELKNYTNSLLGADNKQRSLSGSLGGLSSGLKKVGNAGKKAFLGIGKNVKKTNGHIKKSGGLLQTFASRLKGIALSLLIFNWITKAFNFVVEGIKEGFKNLVQYSDSYNKSVSELMSANTQLKNSFATAFQPLIEMVIPYLVQFVKFLTEAVNKVAQLTAALTGKETWTRAKAVQQDYAKSLDKTAESAEKAAGQLAAFDKLDVLQPKKEDKEDEELKPEDMFEEVPVDKDALSWLDKVKNKLQPLIDYAKELKDLFLKGFFDGLGDWLPRLQNIKDNLKLIKDTLIDIFTDPKVVQAADRYLKSLAYNLGRVVGAFASIGLTIAQNIIGGIAKYLSQNTQRIKDYLVSMFDIGTEINYLIGDFATAIAYIFEAFGGENGQQMTANLIGIFADTFMGITELALKLTRDLMQIFVKPIVENKEMLRKYLDDWYGFVSEILGTIKNAIDNTFDKIHEVYDKHFKPFFDSVAEGLSILLNKFLEFWQENMLPILESLSKKFDSVVAEHIQPALNEFIELLGNLMDVLKILWKSILLPFFSWFIENVLPAASKFVEVYGKHFLNLVEIISDAIANVYKILNGLLDFLLGIFTGDFERATNGIGKIFSGLASTITQVINAIVSILEFLINSFVAGFRLLGEPVSSLGGIFESLYNIVKKIANKILGAIDALVNGVINGINAMISALNGVKFDIPKWVPGFGGKSFGLNIRQVRNVSIPQLAEGAVIRGGNPFMAILGDQPAGHTNIETPLSTMIEAFNQSLDSRGGFGNEVQNINLSIRYEGDLAGLARVLKPVIEAENNRIGVSMITNVGGV